MIFGRELLPRVLDGSKTVTRRRVKPGHRECFYKAGRTYAVQPARGARAIGRIEVVSVETGVLVEALEEYGREGFDSPHAFVAYWTSLRSSFDPRELVHRVEFQLMSHEIEGQA